MNILLLETATEVCSVGVLKAGEMAAEIIATEQFQHASHLTIYIAQCLEQAGLNPAELNFVGLSSGPGSYTSLRVGAATAKGLCLALPGLALLEINTLPSLAIACLPKAQEIQQANRPLLVLPTINSRRDEVYVQVVDANGTPREKAWAETLTTASFASLRHEHTIAVCGNGSDKVKSILGEAPNLYYFPEITCRAANLSPLALAAAKAKAVTDYAAYEPLYLKPPFVNKGRKKLL